MSWWQCKVVTCGYDNENYSVWYLFSQFSLFWDIQVCVQFVIFSFLSARKYRFDISPSVMSEDTMSPDKKSVKSKFSKKKYRAFALARHQNIFTITHEVAKRGNALSVQIKILVAEITSVWVKYVHIVPCKRVIEVVVEAKSIHHKDQFKSQPYAALSWSRRSYRS